jgi:hypothetical protein
MVSNGIADLAATAGKSLICISSPAHRLYQGRPLQTPLCRMPRTKEGKTMPQEQEQEFAGLHIDGPENAYKGYRAPSSQAYEGSGYRREQESPLFALRPDVDAGVNPTFMMQMRLGLLVVSLILWVIVFFGSIWTITKIPTDLASVIDPLIFLGLLIFTLLAALGNYFFGRKR